MSPPSGDHSRPRRNGLGKLLERSEREGFADWKSRLQYLNRPVDLWPSQMSKKAFNRTGPDKQIPNQIPEGFSPGFDQLLAARSGWE